MTALTLKMASVIADAAMEHSISSKFLPMGVAVLDAGGNILVIKRHEKAGLLRPRIAEAKAWGVLGMGYGGREMQRRSVGSPRFHTQLSVISDGRVISSAGGVLIRDESGEVIGAIGVTGDKEIRDEECAVAGIHAAGFIPDTGANMVEDVEAKA
jgi:uncharacterized protein GlcG (DUF336 family)